MNLHMKSLFLKSFRFNKIYVFISTDLVLYVVLKAILFIWKQKQQQSSMDPVRKSASTLSRVLYSAILCNNL